MQFPQFNRIQDVKDFIDSCIIGYKTSGFGFKVFLDETNIAHASNSKKIIRELKDAWDNQSHDIEMKNTIHGIYLLIIDIWGKEPGAIESYTLALDATSLTLEHEPYATSLIASHKGLLIEHTKDRNNGNTNYYLEIFLRLVLERATEREKALSAVTGG